MKELVTSIIQQLVDYPDKMQVNEQTVGNRTEIQIRVDKADRGKIIGKQGRVINAVRTLVNAAASKKNTRVSIEIRD